MALTDRPTLAAAAGAACIASSATLVRLADVEPATAATFRCLYALPVLGLLHAARGPTVRQPAAPGTAGSPLPPGCSSPSTWSSGTTRSLRSAPASRRCWATCRSSWSASSPGGCWASGRAAGWSRRCRSSWSGSCSSPAWSAAAPTASDPGARRRVRARHVAGVRGVPAAAPAGLPRPAPSGRPAVRRDRGGGGASACRSARSRRHRPGARAGRRTAGWSRSRSPPRWSGWLLIAVSLPRVPAALTSVILLLQPVASVALSAAVLDERPSPLQLLGCVIVLVGVVAATAGRREPAGLSRDPADAGSAS